MQFISLNSGSNANSVVVVSGKRTLLIDVGLTVKEIKARLLSIGQDYNAIDAILITHNHSDHIKSIEYVDGTKLYASKGTWDVPPGHELVPFTPRIIAGFEVLPLPISHDAPNGIGFVISDGDETLVYMTDTGYVHQKCLPYMKNAHYYMFESNHDVKMLLESRRPEILKRRILSNEGHLSNEDAAIILCDLIGPNTRKIMLAHLSEEANRPELAIEVFKKIAASRQVDITNIEVKAASRLAVTIGS